MTLLVFFFAGMIVGVALVAIGRASKEADAWAAGFAAGCEHRDAEPLHLARITASDDDIARALRDVVRHVGMPRGVQG